MDLEAIYVYLSGNIINSIILLDKNDCSKAVVCELICHISRISQYFETILFWQQNQTQSSSSGN